ncbi:MAG TPA: hypothetical protein VLQ80_14425, partial [Candidatus Saccharimonadia bacterium]|nr:hypothetical protein [Candidatus Saccharimonadia bacterium]
LVAEMTPVPVQALRMGGARRRETYPQQGDTTDRAIRLQVALGQRPALDTPLRIMDASAPCQRCRKTGCTCPPAPPDIHAAVIRHQARELQRQHEADRLAYPVYAHWRNQP